MTEDPTNPTTEGAPAAGAPAPRTTWSVQAAFRRVLQELEAVGLDTPAQARIAPHLFNLVEATLHHSLDEVLVQIQSLLATAEQQGSG